MLTLSYEYCFRVTVVTLCQVDWRIVTNRAVFTSHLDLPKQKVDVHLYEGTRWFVYVSICVCCKSSTEEGGTKVDCDAREPDDYKE